MSSSHGRVGLHQRLPLVRRAGAVRPPRAAHLEVVRTILGEASAEQLAATSLATSRPRWATSLTPTWFIAQDMLALRVRLAADGTPLRSLAHVTGGGLPGNVPRVA
jgi:phosphoribosylaminoimidazole (AIR) synthetase